MDWLQPLGLALASVAAMEAVAWASHKYLMHGPGYLERHRAALINHRRPRNQVVAAVP